MRRFRRRPWARMLAVVASILGGAWLIYVIAANFVLAGWLERKLSERPDRMQLELASAWTLWPGRVHVRGFRLLHAEDKLQLEIRFERGTVDLRILPLLEKTFHVDSVHADGLSVRFRRLLEDPASAPLRVKALPTFDGLPALPRAKPKGPPSDPERLWTIILDRIDVRTRELWFDEFRYDGTGRIGGAFRFAPARELQVRHSRVELGPAPLWLGRVEPIADRVQGVVEGHLETLDVSDDAPGGWGVFEKFTLHGELEADVASVEWSRAYTKPGAPRLERGRGELELSLHVERGRIEPKSHARYRTPELFLWRGGYALRGDAKLALDMAGEIGRARLSGKRVELLRARRRAPIGELVEFTIELSGETADLTEDWKSRDGRLEIERASVSDLGALGALGNGQKLTFHGGALSGRAQAKLDRRGQVSGGVDLRAQGVQLSVKGVRVHGTGSGEARFQKASVSAPAVGVRDAKLDLSHFSFATEHGKSGPGKLSLRAPKLEIGTGKSPRFDVSFAAAFPEADGVMNALEIADSGIERLGRALVDLEDLSIRGSVHGTESGVVVRLARAETDGVSVSGVIAPEQSPGGSVAVDLGILEFDVEVER